MSKFWFHGIENKIGANPNMKYLIPGWLWHLTLQPCFCIMSNSARNRGPDVWTGAHYWCYPITIVLERYPMSIESIWDWIRQFFAKTFYLYRWCVCKEYTLLFTISTISIHVTIKYQFHRFFEDKTFLNGHFIFVEWVYVYIFIYLLIFYWHLICLTWNRWFLFDRYSSISIKNEINLKWDAL